MTDEELAGLAETLASAAGLTRPTALRRLAGGRNNRVFHVSMEDGSCVVLKLYHSDPRDPRDRLGAEWSFLNYVWERGVRNVPRPLTRDKARHAALYDFVPGRKIAADEIDAAVVAKAADFVIAINGEPCQPERLAPGSEACFSMADHLATVDRRVARLDGIDEHAPFAAEAASLVANRLHPLWQRASSAISEGAKAEGIALDASIASVCVSPSDFGFHNALLDEAGRAGFIDFEYAGRDDPAKLVCDFFCQPEVPVPPAAFDAFVAAIAGPLGLVRDDLWRCRTLLPAYRLKWVCIILNEFLPIGASRRAFADEGDRAIRAQQQIDNARRQLDLVATQL
ncbi:phosphotransferase [Phreatobacter stygius]|uniref:Aminoglycoside phosphotransferase family protein n=1 Tax=Phreatobacter stygius TaxID=1940610 RepID=A0A4D7AU65_9HYPH|nr:phosphotransferase [Phreatobacter stygius]QCI63185.1 aminoglycoside phosphotransferase family protein [Phreatobacter stygius]